MKAALRLHSGDNFIQLQRSKFTRSRSANRSAPEYCGLVYQLVFLFLILYHCVFVVFIILLWRHCSGGQSPASHLEGRVEFQVSPCGIFGGHNGRHCERSSYEYSALSLLYELAISPLSVIVYHRRCVTSATNNTVKLALKICNCANSLLIFVFFVILLS